MNIKEQITSIRKLLEIAKKKLKRDQAAIEKLEKVLLEMEHVDGMLQEDIIVPRRGRTRQEALDVIENLKQDIQKKIVDKQEEAIGHAQG